MIDSKNFIFKAETVIPARSGMRQLNSDYDVKVFNDSLITYLPYFGRAYSIPVDPSRGGIQFTSTQFDYTVKEKNKGRWNITIRPKNELTVRQMLFNVYENGRATLQVTSNDRQPITFNGYITSRQN